MSDIQTVLGEGTVQLEFDESFYPKDAIYGAAYVFIDRCYVHLERSGDKRVRVTLRAKNGQIADSQALSGELENELLGQAWRLSIAAENRQLIESITARALGGAAGPPGLDELLAMDIDEATAFDDPLGIAMSWEEKYKKKGGKTEDETAKEVRGNEDETVKVPPVAMNAASEAAPTEAEKAT
jgi:His-Xaa-Ser system protein HxsD